MAEAAGLVIGTIGLAGLFTNCIECIDYISLGRNYGKDHEMSMTKLVLLEARLSAWGESLRVTGEGKENAALRDRWSQEQDTVGKCLVGIKSIFEDSKKLESKYGLEPISVEQDSSSIRKAQRSQAFQQIEDKFKARIKSRQNNVSASKHIRWAIRDNKKFDSMIADLAFFIGGLEDLSDRLQMSALLQRLPEAEAQAITDVNAISMMEEASTCIRALSLSKSSDKEDSRRDIKGHTYFGTIIKDRAKVLNGDFGLQSQSSHSFHSTQASNEAHVVQGDMSFEAGKAFFTR